jgi:adenylate cyclase
MRKFLLPCLALFMVGITLNGEAQTRTIDSLNSLLSKAVKDSIKLEISQQLGREFNLNGNYDEAIRLFKNNIALAEKLGDISTKIAANSLMGSAFRKKGDFINAISCFDKAYQMAKNIGDKNQQGSIINKMGITYWRQGIFPKALSSFFESLKIAEELGDKRGIGNALGNIGLIYTAENKPKEALLYHTKALELFEVLQNKKEIAASYQNIGNVYNDMGNFETAIKKYTICLKIKKEIGDKEGELIALINISHTLIETKKLQLARLYNDSASFVANEIESEFHIAECLKQKGTILFYTSNYVESKKFLLEAAGKASKIDAISLLDNCYFYLTKTDSAMGNWKSAFHNHKLYTYYNSLLHNDENNKKMTEQKMQYEFDKKEAILRAEQEKKNAISLEEQARSKQQKIILVLGLILAVFFGAWDYRQKQRISKQKKRSDELLLNILPEEVAEELKAKGSAEAKQIEQVTVLFTDFKGFTQLSEKLAPKELVAEINECFSAFDHIMEKYGVEKIKTIGDAYMAAGGLPTANSTHAVDVVKAALDIQRFMHDHKIKKTAANELFFEIRIGVHTGPVVAGIVGVKKFAYDIWGDTVNTASRMESSGEVGKVNISETTYHFVKNDFNCVFRGEIQAKGKGNLKMYFLE